MNLLSSLVPLETLDGWPTAPPVSVVGTLLLLVGVPALIFLIVFGVAALRPAQSAYDSMQEREALWVGAGAPEAVTESSGRRAAISAADSARSEGNDDAGKGGASARW